VIVKARGAHVIGTARAEKHAFLRDLGADELIDYTEVDFTTVIRDVDVVFDLVGDGYAARSLDTLKPGGLLIDAVGGEQELTVPEVEPTRPPIRQVLRQPVRKGPRADQRTGRGRRTARTARPGSAAGTGRQGTRTQRNQPGQRQDRAGDLDQGTLTKD
jgi:NADPH:quinone reductase-like Zn-dependent oxidoreductase